MSTLNLFSNDGKLSYIDQEGNIAIVVVVYPEGDCDTFDWPLDTTYRSEERQQNDIISAIYDDREMGRVASHVDRVELPDGGGILLL